MTEAEATAVVAKMLAAFPSAKREQSTIAVYVEKLQRCNNSTGALEAMDRLIDGHRDARALPTVAAFFEEYRGSPQYHDPHHDRHFVAELELPAMSDTSIAENKQVRVPALLRWMQMPAAQRPDWRLLIDQFGLAANLKPSDQAVLAELRKQAA